MIGYERHLLALRHEAGAVAAAASLDLSATVPSCPGWTVEGVVAHLGNGFRAIAGLVRDHADAEVAFEGAPPPSEGIVAWFEESVAELVEAFATEDPGAPAWNWSGRDETVAFWARRMAHEIAVHRWDVEAAVGTPAPVEPELAADGVDEMFGVFLPHTLDERPVDGLAGTFAVTATDTGDTWLGRLLPDAAEVRRVSAPEPADAMLRGTASDLVLVLWGRPGTVETAGDERIVGLLTR